MTAGIYHDGRPEYNSTRSDGEGPKPVFGIGLPEFALIAFVAVLVFGPDKLPELARQAGSFLRKAKAFAVTARDELREELGPKYADLELQDLDPRAIVRRHIVEAMEDVKSDAAPQRRVLRTLTEGEVPPCDAEAT